MSNDNITPENHPDDAAGELDKLEAKFEDLVSDLQLDTVTALGDALTINEELRARIAHYEKQASEARHAFKALRHAKHGGAVVVASEKLRDALREIHPSTEVK